MNKLTKVGLSALCGSLAGISAANAGDMTVTGGVDMSWVSFGGGQSTTGNPIGIGSNLTFKGSGELDNGWTFGLTVAMLNQDAYSNTVLNLDMGGLGKLNINQGDSGNGIDALDDKMPTAWEEPWGAGLGAGIQLVSGVGPKSNVQYTSPKFAGTTIALAVAPDFSAGNANDKGNSVSADTLGAGYDATISINPSFGTEMLSGLNVYLGGHFHENNQVADTASGDASLGKDNEHYEAVAAIVFDIGPVSIGGGRSGILTGKTVASTAVDYYRNNMYGVAFNINDDLSVSYGKHESEKNFVNPGLNEAVTLDVESYQIAYTIGGASIRYAEIEVDNGAYQTTNPFDKDARVISLSLAF